MRRTLRALTLAPLLAGLCVSSIQAQRCNVLERRYDNPLSDSHSWAMPAVAWHASYAVLSLGTAYLIHRATKLSTTKSAWAATLGLGLVPHVRGLVRHSYPFDAGDWSFDLSNRGLPAYLTLGTSRGSLAYAASYAALVCWSSP